MPSERRSPLLIAHALGYGGELCYNALHGIAGGLLWELFTDSAWRGIDAHVRLPETVRNRWKRLSGKPASAVTESFQMNEIVTLRECQPSIPETTPARRIGLSGGSPIDKAITGGDMSTLKANPVSGPMCSCFKASMTDTNGSSNPIFDKSTHPSRENQITE